MRSITLPGAPGRCPRCWMLDGFCLCSVISPRPSAPRIVVVRHHWEARKSTNTARIAALALSNLQLIDMAEEPEPAQAALSTLANAWLLYPGSEAASRLVRPPETLIVLDGTWRQTRRMLRRLPELSLLPRFALAETQAPRLRLRQPPVQGARSTLESIADALGELDSSGLGAELIALHQRFVEQTFRARGTQPENRSFR